MPTVRRSPGNHFSIMRICLEFPRWFNKTGHWAGALLHVPVAEQSAPKSRSLVGSNKCKFWGGGADIILKQADVRVCPCAPVGSQRVRPVFGFFPRQPVKKC